MNPKKNIQQLYWLRKIGIEYIGLEKQEAYQVFKELLSSCKTASEKINELRSNSASSTSKVPKQGQKKDLFFSPTKDSTANLEYQIHLEQKDMEQEHTRNLVKQITNLEQLRNLVMEFEGCSLKKLSTNTVFADGNPKASIMLIGEAPGANEDKMGIPFCGESGKLLDNMLATIGISRQDNAYITNTIFWRPPANREPTQEEINICKPFIEKHIALINPKLIILVGSTAATSLLGKHAGITKIRQEYYQYHNEYLAHPITMTAIFHPAYLLRQPLQKKTAWYDLLKIQQFIKENIK